MALAKRFAVAALISGSASALAPVPPAAAAPGSGGIEVIGGTAAAQGAWPDAAGVLYPNSGPNQDDEALCSGTLIAPSIVITAGHCYTDNFVPDNVLLGTNSLANPAQGETIKVRTGLVAPNPETNEDVTALILETPSTITPRPLATGWAAVDIQNGAAVEIVGFGAISSDGMTFVDALQQATTKITDANCTKSAGCRAADQPNGELGAGGGGIDTCPGDSGGPLYLQTSYGTFLAGVTSRGYSNSTVVCSGGGIYERPDKFIDWLDTATGTLNGIGNPPDPNFTVTRGPEPSIPAITVTAGGSADAKITVNDPTSNTHSFELTAQPAHGKAGVDSQGNVRVCPDANAAAGSDSVQVLITDDKNTKRALTMTVPFTVAAGTPSGTPCDLSAFGADGGGCCETGHGAGGAIPLAVGVLAFVMRRRRRS
jgi:endonuclease G